MIKKILKNLFIFFILLSITVELTVIPVIAQTPTTIENPPSPPPLPQESAITTPDVQLDVIDTPVPTAPPLPENPSATPSGSPVLPPPVDSQAGLKPTVSVPAANRPAFTITGLPQSASIKKKMKLLALTKRNFQPNEFIGVNLINVYDPLLSGVTIRVKNKQGEELPIVYEKEIIGDEINLKIRPARYFKPGKYQLEITDQDGVKSSQDFTWGVLAINTNKSVFKPGEKALIAITVLDETGVTLCDTFLQLSVKSPDGGDSLFSTSDGSIKINDSCGNKKVTYLPDYESEYQIGQSTGTYTLTLTAETKNGIYTVNDRFTVETNPLFEVERQSVTRIFPLNNYAMTFNIKANIDFDGQIVETVPNNFKILPFDQDTARSYDRLATSSAGLNNQNIAGVSTGSVLGLPFEGSFPLTLGFGETPDSDWLAGRYRSFGLNAHDAQDFAMPEGTPLLATDDGLITLSGPDVYGVTIIIKHDWGRSYYGHLSQTMVTAGQNVSKGDLIGYSGNTGLSTGPHLHFAVQPNAVDYDNGFYGKINPLPLMGMSRDGQILGESTSVFTESKIYWDVSLKKGDSLKLAYIFDPPELSPQFYLLGPMVFESGQLTAESPQPSPSPTLMEETVDPAGQIIPGLSFEPEIESGLSLIPLEATQPATISPALSDISPQPSPNIGITPTPVSSARTVFSETRQWQIAADADVTIDASANNNVSAWYDQPKMVFISDLTGYFFYRDTDGECYFIKTTDGGASWTGQTTITDTVDCQNVAIWYDRWTPGDLTGNYIHIIHSDRTNSNWMYTRVDTANSDTLLTAVDITSGTVTVDLDTNGTIIRATDGEIYAAWTDQNAPQSRIVSCSSSCDDAGNWANVGTNPQDAADPIALMSLPDGDAILIRLDESDSVADLEYNIWNQSSWGGWQDIDTDVTDQTAKNPNPISVAIRRNTFDIYIIYIHSPGTDDLSEVRSAYWNGASFSTKTDCISSDDTGSGQDIVHTAISIDEESATVYCIYHKTVDDGTSDANVFYKTSTDNMTSWSSEAQLNTSNINTKIIPVYSNMVDSERIYFAYKISTATSPVYGGTIVDLEPPVNDQLMKHGLWFSGVGQKKEFTW